jgi:hypothetical protein
MIFMEVPSLFREYVYRRKLLPGIAAVQAGRRTPRRPLLCAGHLPGRPARIRGEPVRIAPGETEVIHAFPIKRRHVRGARGTVFRQGGLLPLGERVQPMVEQGKRDPAAAGEDPGERAPQCRRGAIIRRAGAAGRAQDHQGRRRTGVGAHRAGNDLTFSAPKSVSVGYAAGESALKEIWDRAVLHTMRHQKRRASRSGIGEGVGRQVPPWAERGTLPE